jgi:predicted nucleic acid-binding Zn ribbon protein
MDLAGLDRTRPIVPNHATQLKEENKNQTKKKKKKILSKLQKRSKRFHLFLLLLLLLLGRLFAQGLFFFPVHIYSK